MSKTSRVGRLGNQIVRNMAVSFIAKKHNLYVNYFNYELIKKIGIDLFIGENKYDTTTPLTDSNYFNILECDTLLQNVDPNNNYFQTKKITDMIFNHLNTQSIMNRVMSSNKYKDRYNNNNDCFIHVRLGDVSKWNPGFTYYDGILSQLNIHNIIIATDSPNHAIIKQLQAKYSIRMMGEDLDEIFMFGSTSKYVILSYGTFSALIGYLSYYSTVYYKSFNAQTAWDWTAIDECDMFRNHSNKIGEWIEI